jgi:hypothetical protein
LQIFKNRFDYEQLTSNSLKQGGKKL